MTFYDLLTKYNFRTITSGEDMDNTQTIRVRIPSKGYVKDMWFEYGVYDYSSSTIDIIRTSLNPKLLNNKVTSINVNEKYNILEIWLGDE